MQVAFYFLYLSQRVAASQSISLRVSPVPFSEQFTFAVNPMLSDIKERLTHKG